METPAGSYRLVWQIAARVFRIAGAIAIVVLLIMATLLSAMWWEHRSPLTLPTPSGPFPVGRVSYTWTNTAATDEFASVRGAKRQVVSWIWYPAASSPQSVTAEYVPASWRAATQEQLGFFLRTFLKRDEAVIHVHSVLKAAVSTARPAYPVVLLRAGGSALTTDFTTLAEDLASHGFIVAGFDAPYRSFVVVLPDGRVAVRDNRANVENANSNLDDPLVGKLLGMWVDDTAFVTDQLERLNADNSGIFKGRMDMARLGAFGHSFGGATALEFCHTDPRCKAAIDIDGIPFGSVVTQGLGKPGMFLLSDHSREPKAETGRVLAEIQTIYDRLPEVRMYAVLKQANHFSFSDQILTNSQVAFAVMRLMGIGGLNGRRGLAITADYVHTFFDVNLNGAPATDLTQLQEKYPEVQIQGR